MNPISRSEYDELMRRVTTGEASHVIIQADIVRIDKDVALVVHSIEGDGVAGLADDVKALKIWKASLDVTPKELKAIIDERTKDTKASRYRLIIAVVSILGGISTLILIGTWIAGLIAAAQAVRK
jgi:hypothetical protein